MFPDTEMKKDEQEIPQRIGRKTRELREIFITGILFGFTINLLSDFISAWAFVNPPMDIIVLLLSLFGTAAIFMFLIWEYLGDEGRYLQEVTTQFIWDTKTGELVRIAGFYLPQLIAKFQYELLDSEKQSELKKLFSKTPSNLDQRDLALLNEIFENALRYRLHDERFLKEHPSPHEVLGFESLGLKTDLSNVTKDIQLRSKCKILKARFGQRLDLQIPLGALRFRYNLSIRETMEAGTGARTASGIDPRFLLNYDSVLRVADVFKEKQEVPEKSSLVIAEVKTLVTTKVKFRGLILGGQRANDTLLWMKRFLSEFYKGFDIALYMSTLYGWEEGIKLGKQIGFGRGLQ